MNNSFKNHSFRFLFEIFSLQNNRNTSYGNTMKQISIYNFSCRSVPYKRDSFHFLGTWFCNIYFIHTNIISIFYFSYKTKTSFLDFCRKIQETFFFKKMPVSFRIFFKILVRIESELTHNSRLFNEKSRDKVTEKYFLPYSHSSGNVSCLTIKARNYINTHNKK